MEILHWTLTVTAVIISLSTATHSFLVDDNVAPSQSCPACGPCTCGDVPPGEDHRPVVTLSSGLQVVCDTETDDGGWIVFQRRTSKLVDFYRNWDDYKYGFGDLHGNFWLGLETVHRLTTQRRYELRVDLVFNGTNYFAEYSGFKLYGEAEGYKLLVSGYSGTAGDSLDVHNGRPFTTKDRDNDSNGSNCAQQFHGGWWYVSCHSSNLNGLYGDTRYGQGLSWHASQDYYHSATFSEMKIRPLD